MLVMRSKSLTTEVTEVHREAQGKAWIPCVSLYPLVVKKGLVWKSKKSAFLVVA
jgi:hypothetical protein